MKTYESTMIRNVSLIAHGGAGKTSLAECILFNSGSTTRIGKTTDGNTIMDFEPEEIGKQISISTGVAFLEWKKHQINLIDTPGDANFFADTVSCLAGVDGAVVVIDSASGVEVQTEKAWDRANEFSLPRIVFVNKMDRERANFDMVLKDLKEIFKINPLPLQIPVGKEDFFRGVVDVLSGKAYLFETDGSGKFQAGEIPAELSEAVEQYRSQAVESIAESDDALLERYLEGEELPREELAAGLKAGLLSGAIVPVVCGSAALNIGVQMLMDLIVEGLPSPLDRPDLTGHKPDAPDQALERKRQPADPFSAVVFKTSIDPFAGKLSIFRVFSGTLKSDSTFYNSSRDVKERVGQLLKLFGKKQEPVGEAVTGDIVAAVKLKETKTGDTMCVESDPIVYNLVKIPQTALSFAIQPKAKGDEEKIASGLARIMEEDPTVEIRRDQQTKEIILSGMGQGHLETTIEKLKRKFGVEVTLQTPRVPYKETIKGRADNVEGKHKKQTGGRGQFGVCYINLEPMPRGEGFEFDNKIVGGTIPRQYIPAVEKGIREAMELGAIAGYPVVDTKVTLFDGKFHTVDSSELAFKIAGSLAFKKAVLNSNPVLLEPIMNIEVTTPEDKTGDIMGDMNSRRGRVAGVEAKGKNSVIKAQVPLAEILRYEPDLRSMTSGKGSYLTTFSHYEEVPAHLAQNIIEEAQKAKKDEE